MALDRSRCDTCHRALAPWELVPLASYALLGGTCRSCGAPIGRFHPAIELAALAVAGWVVAISSTPWADCALGWVLLGLAWIDWEHRRLPDVLTLPLLVLGLLVAWHEAGFGLVGLAPGSRLTDGAIGAALGYAAFRLVTLAYRAWRGREGLGHGDAKLLAASGAWVGWDRLDLVVLLGALLSIGMALLQGRGNRLSATTSVPFGPGLAMATLVVRLHG